MSKVSGIDVSDWQDPIDFSSVRDAGYSFVYAKATEGNNYVADTFVSKRTATRAAGLIWGAYHFMDWTQSGFSQGTAFISQAKYERGDLMPMIDCEGVTNLTPYAATQKISAVLRVIESRIARKCAIYLSPSFWSDALGSTDLYNDRPLWLANYGVSSPPNLGEWKPMFWQYTSSATVPGIEGNVDVDEFFGTLDDLKGLRGT
jgi:lysozyme